MILAARAQPSFPWQFFLGLALVLLSLSPAHTHGMGYMDESLAATNQVTIILGDWLRLQPASTSVDWPRSGYLQVLIEMPFVILGRSIGSPAWLDLFSALQPIVITSLMLTVSFLWIRRLTGSDSWSWVLSTGAGLTTMIWPYAYMGMETTQSLFLLLAGYLSLDPRHQPTWKRSFALALSIAFTVSVKTTSVFLLPALGFLLARYFRIWPREAPRPGASQSWRLQAVALIGIVAAVWITNGYMQWIGWEKHGGAVGYASTMIIDSAFDFFLHALSFFGSPNKSVFLFAPIVFLSVLSLQKAWRIDRDIAIFAAATFASLCFGYSFFIFWTDETWGPRYLHAAIVPSILCIAVARATPRFRLRRHPLLVGLFVLGFVVSGLGVLFPYRMLPQAAHRVRQGVLEAYQYDPVWNHPRFNARLLGALWQSSRHPQASSVFWTPSHYWWPKRPNAPASQSVNLTMIATPQPAVLRGVAPALFTSSLLAGTILLILSGRSAFRADASEQSPSSQDGDAQAPSGAVRQEDQSA